MNTVEMKTLAKGLGLKVIKTPGGLNPRILWTENKCVHNTGKNVTIRGTSTEKQWDGTYGFMFQIIGDFNAYSGLSIDNIRTWGCATPEEALNKSYKKLRNRLRKYYEINL